MKAICSVLRQPALRRTNLGKAAGKVSFILFTVLGLLLAAPGPAWAKSNNNNKSSQLSSEKHSKILDRHRERLEIKDDAEWEVIRPRIENILRAEKELRDALSSSSRKLSSPKDRNSRTSSESASASSRSEPQPDTDVVLLRRLVEGNAPAKEIKERLTRVRQMIQQKRDALENAQEELRSVLSVRQEAIAVLQGLLR
jgi:hypothetical protein